MLVILSYDEFKITEYIVGIIAIAIFLVVGILFQLIF